VEKKNLFDMANQNSTRLKMQYDSLIKKQQSSKLKQFLRIVNENWSLSINMGQSTLINFLSVGKYKNIYYRTREESQKLHDIGKKLPEGKILKRRLGKYYKKRITFDNTFKYGKKFKYSSLSIGGLGPIEKYGEYCVVLKRKKSEEYSLLAFIKEDSLKYVEPDTIRENKFIVNIEDLKRDVASKEYVNFLVTIKHKGEIESKSPKEWPSMIFNEKDYVEGIIADEILNTHIGRLRMKESDYKSFYEDLYDEIISKDGNKATNYKKKFRRYRMKDFLTINEMLNKLGIEIEVL